MTCGLSGSQVMGSHAEIPAWPPINVAFSHATDRGIDSTLVLVHGASSHGHMLPRLTHASLGKTGRAELPTCSGHKAVGKAVTGGLRT